MFSIRRPTSEEIDRFIKERQTDSFSYPEIGATIGSPPPRYNIDHNRLKLGAGKDDFARARSAIRNWKMFDLDWVELISPDKPIENGQTVAILVKHFGFFSLNAARIVYLIDEIGEVERYGFGYGTLTEHGEIGEERFSVEFHAQSQEVWYDLYAFSRPGATLAKIGYPLSRYLQKAFARDSKQAMLDAVLNDID